MIFHGSTDIHVGQERLKTQRAEAQKKIASDYQKRLAILKSRIENDHREKREIMYVILSSSSKPSKIQVRGWS